MLGKIAKTGKVMKENITLFMSVFYVQMRFVTSYLHMSVNFLENKNECLNNLENREKKTVNERQQYLIKLVLKWLKLGSITLCSLTY